MSIKKGSFYIRQIPNTNQIEVTPLGSLNSKKRFVMFSEKEYATYVDWQNTDDDVSIDEALHFLTPKDRKLINENFDCREYSFEENYE